ncbi:pentapeptide repeat-containing protein [Amycolatopsis mongoliensis]|uniref:Pentapeptide repeat-containing protein n=1 Tax=Amycolatopsis mongoliensis TaxID=715475 RepID=A0A9Y2JW83_9PSEU|nr:pentapeptide repeat-containing protein [Amycolatopsis sp. 4-36]WIY04764.1 pentapeptide repeat-containing protein [Amycolatopsis sp. 4-36]
MKRFSPLAAAFLLSAVVFAGVLVWLLAEHATNRGDALKTAGLAGGAVAALYGLWLNDRRRRTEEDRHELERSRISDERFAKAVELLGHQADQVRVGAIHALAGLARTRPDVYAQTVLDVLCAYLRLPFAHGDFGDPVDEPAVAEREGQVRRTAQQVIQSLLARVGTPDAPAYTLDLSGARLDRFTLAGRRVGRLGAQGTTIVNGAAFTDTSFEGSAFFTGAEIHGPVEFVRTKFGSGTGFRDFTVHDEVTFTDVGFATPPDFTQARFPAGTELP